MKYKFFILTFFTFFLGTAFGQEKVIDSLEIKRIESAVNTTLSDSTLQKITIDNVTLSNQFDNQQLYSLDVYLKDKEIVRVSIAKLPLKITVKSVRNEIIDFFIKGTLVYINEKYTNCSRMGSCGCIDIENKLYYKQGTLLGTITSDSCYGSLVATDWLYNTFKEFYAIAQKHIDKLYSQTEQYSKSNGEQMSVEEWNRMKKLNDLKIYDTVDVEAKLKSGQKIAMFDFEFKHLENESEIILNGTIEKDGSITGINYSNIKDDTIVKNLRTFFIEISNSKIFEPGILENKIVRSKVLLKVVLKPKINRMNIIVL